MFAKILSEKPGTCKGSRDVVLDLNIHKEGRQSEGHVALTAQADVMETCRALKKKHTQVHFKKSHL